MNKATFRGAALPLLAVACVALGGCNTTINIVVNEISLEITLVIAFSLLGVGVRYRRRFYDMWNKFRPWFCRFGLEAVGGFFIALALWLLFRSNTHRIALDLLCALAVVCWCALVNRAVKPRLALVWQFYQDRRELLIYFLHCYDMKVVFNDIYGARPSDFHGGLDIYPEIGENDSHFRKNLTGDEREYWLRQMRLLEKKGRVDVISKHSPANFYVYRLSPKGVKAAQKAERRTSNLAA